MKRYLLLAILIFNLSAEEFVRRTEPTKPTLISDQLGEKLKKAIGPVPEPNSDTQKKDVETVLQAQKTRTTSDCEAAKKEVDVSMSVFFGPDVGIFDKEQTKKLQSAMEAIRNDANYYVQAFKKETLRKRPYDYLAGVVPCITKETSLAYPSGHAALARLYALILGDLDPTKRDALEKRAAEIGKHRYIAGVHHPSDVEAGFRLADALYIEFKASPKFKTELISVNKAIKDR